MRQSLVGAPPSYHPVWPAHHLEWGWACVGSSLSDPIHSRSKLYRGGRCLWQGLSKASAAPAAFVRLCDGQCGGRCLWESFPLASAALTDFTRSYNSWGVQQVQGSLVCGVRTTLFPILTFSPTLLTPESTGPERPMPNVSKSVCAEGRCKGRWREVRQN